MKDTTKQVVILDNFSSPYIHQAIIVLKKYDPDAEPMIIKEAERIVDRYLDQNLKRERNFKKDPRIKIIHTLCLCAVCLAGAIFMLSYII